jgi:Zn-dependent peptidase ImmA (M78 family)
MDANFEFMAGDKKRFAFKIGFSPDPHKGKAAAKALGLSWGGFQIWVGGKNLCRHEEGGEILESAYWYLLPLLEWFAANWDPLLHEERLPNEHQRNNAQEYDAWSSLSDTRFPPMHIENKEAARGEWETWWQLWWKRHGIAGCREGGIYPDVVIRRFGEAVEFSWGPSAPAETPEGFFFSYDGGHGFAGVQDVARPLYRVLSLAAEQLLSRDPSEKRFQELCEAVRRIPMGNADQRQGWLAGLGATREAASRRWQEARILLRRAGRHAEEMLKPREVMDLAVPGACDAAVMFGSLAPGIDEQDVLAIARAMVEVGSAVGDPEALQRFVRPVALGASFRKPWEEGYSLALRFLEDAGLPGEEDQFVDIEGILGKLGVRTDTIRLGDASVRALAFAGPRHTPSIVLNRTAGAYRHPSARRFALAHELCHILYDRKQGNQISLASGPWAPRGLEARADAFATMLLMPAALINRDISQLDLDISTAAGVAGLAAALRVEFTALTRHLVSHGMLTGEQYVHVLDEAVLGAAKGAAEG